MQGYTCQNRRGDRVESCVFCAEKEKGEKMENRLLFELDKEELIALRDTLNYAINIADEVEKARKNFKGLDEEVIELISSVHPLTTYARVNGEEVKVAILPVAKKRE